MRATNPLQSHASAFGGQHTEQIILIQPEPLEMLGETEPMPVQQVLNEAFMGFEMTLRPVAHDLHLAYMDDDQAIYSLLPINHLGTILLSGVMGRLMEVRGALVVARFDVRGNLTAYPLTPSAQSWLNSAIVDARELMAETGLADRLGV